MIKCFDDIDKMAAEISSSTPKVLAVAAADEVHILDAVCEARNLGIINAVLVGNENNIIRIAQENGFVLHDMEIINIDDGCKAAQKAVELVRTGKAHMLMKGLVDSSVYLKAILDKENGLRDSKLLSFASLCEIDKLKRLLIITDPAINLEPGLEEKEIIMKNAVSFAKALGNDCPKVAFICPIEKVNPKMNSTLHAKALTEKYQGSRDFMVDGPFGLDIAISREAAKIKGMNGPVAGNADILILNDLGVGNVFYKSITFLSESRMADIVIGAKAPVLMCSRSDNTVTKLNSIKLGVILASSDLLSEQSAAMR